MSQLTAEDIKKIYSALPAKHKEAREKLGRPITLAEKILTSHLDHWPEGGVKGGETYAFLRPDRVAMQDATAQMAILQFMQAQLKSGGTNHGALRSLDPRPGGCRERYGSSHGRQQRSF